MTSFYKTLIILSLFVFLKQLFAAPVREIDLNKNWSLRNQNGSINVTNLELPSGVYSACSAYFTGSPDGVLKSYNDVNLRWIAQDNWTYSLLFDAPVDYTRIRSVNLTFHGVDTIAKITLNDKVLGYTNNMFVRYSFDIKDILTLKRQNKLEVSITSPIYAAKELASKNSFTPPECPIDRYHGECHMNFLRKMQASFAWDWGLAAPSMGIWKSVTLEIHDMAIIRDVNVVLSKKSKYWVLTGRVYLETALNQLLYGNLTVFALDLLEDPIKVSFKDKPVKGPSPVLEFSEKIPDDKVELWWPNGYGKQKLYHLHFTWTGWLGEEYNPRELTVSQKSIRIGFRTIELVQDKMPNGLSFYFRINGIPIFMKGSNYIPSHILPENAQNQARIKHLLESAKISHMNMLRVWGGGIYESDFFYDMADYYGILIWQDMMFACAMYPTFPEFLASVQLEVIQNIQRITYHPSIAILSGNNENEAALVQNWYGTAGNYSRFASEYIHLYVDTIRNSVKKFQNISPPDVPEFLVSSPSNGQKSEDDGYISKDPQNPNYGDIHHYDYAHDGWDPNIYPHPRFASEYGFQSLPSLTSWKRILGPNDKLEELFEHRQHALFGNIPIVALNARHFPIISKEDPDYYDAFIYFSQISQAMVTKTETEVYRSQRNGSQNTMGALYWQLNDVWIAPSWSGIDYDGNFKILQHWTKDFMAPVTIIAHLNRQRIINIYVVRDTIEPKNQNYLITMNVYLWSNQIPERTEKWLCSIPPNTASLVKQINLDNEVLIKPFNKNNCYLEFKLQSHENEMLATHFTIDELEHEDKFNGLMSSQEVSRTYLFPDKLKYAVGMKDPKIGIEILKQSCEKDKPTKSASVVVTVQAPAIFVYLELTNLNITSYQFSKNGFIQTDPIQTIHLEYKIDSCIDITASDIKVLTVNKFMNKNTEK